MSKKLVKTSLSEDELELIEAIRNYKKAYPNGQDELLWYVQQRKWVSSQFRQVSRKSETLRSLVVPA